MSNKAENSSSSEPENQTGAPSIDAENAWSALQAELNTWSSAGHIASFWWRDDDAVRAGPRLDKLIDISSNSGLMLAVIPTHLEPSLATALADAPQVYVAQHGYAHVNHAPRGLGLGAWELGMHRGLDTVMAEIHRGRAILEDRFQSQFLQVLVPPWNRIAPELIKPVADSGFCGVSAFGPRDQNNPVQGMTFINAHCDPIRWKSGAQFRGTSKTISQLCEHLEARRTGRVDVDEPTGFLTHHIDLDAAGWNFSKRLANMIHQHKAARWCSPKQLFMTSDGQGNG